VSSAIGYGIRAAQDFAQGEPVLNYCGELLDSRAEMEVRKRKYADGGKGNFIFGFPNFRNKWHWYKTIFVTMIFFELNYIYLTLFNTTLLTIVYLYFYNL
jgi:hypothetical protein